MEARVAEMKDRLHEVIRFTNGDRPDVDIDVVYELLGS